MEWIKGRPPTEEELEHNDIGFIVCISGSLGHRTYDHAVVLGMFYVTDGSWYTEDGWIDTSLGDITVHGWMLPPKWEE